MLTKAMLRRVQAEPCLLLAKRNRALLGRLHGSDRLLRRATFNFMKKGIIAACAWPAFWICYASGTAFLAMESCLMCLMWPISVRPLKSNARGQRNDSMKATLCSLIVFTAQSFIVAGRACHWASMKCYAGARWCCCFVESRL